VAVDHSQIPFPDPFPEAYHQIQRKNSEKREKVNKTLKNPQKFLNLRDRHCGSQKMEAMYL